MWKEKFALALVVPPSNAGKEYILILVSLSDKRVFRA